MDLGLVVDLVGGASFKLFYLKMQLFIHSQTWTMQPLEFGNG